MQPAIRRALPKSHDDSAGVPSSAQAHGSNPHPHKQSERKLEGRRQVLSMPPTACAQSCTSPTHPRVPPSRFPLSWLRIPFHSWMWGIEPTTRIPTTTRTLSSTTTKHHPHRHAPRLGSLPRLPQPGPSSPPSGPSHWQYKVGCNHQPAEPQIHRHTVTLAVTITDINTPS